MLNIPVKRSFMLKSTTIRYMTETDYVVYQEFLTADAGANLYTRYCQHGNWSEWTKQ